jgi:hypothetical protein
MTAIPLAVFLVSVLVGAIFGLYLSTLLLRAAIRIVAGFTPVFWNACMALVVAFIAMVVFLVVTNLFGIFQQQTMGTYVLQYVALALVEAAAYSMVIKDRNGRQLSYMAACLAHVVMFVIMVLFMAVLYAGAVATGHKPDLTAYRQRVLKMQHDIETMRIHGITLPGIQLPAIPIPNPAPMGAEATPAPVYRYFTKGPIEVKVTYGNVTIPGNTEVRLISQVGDSCQIQVGNLTYTVSRSQLVTVPPSY